MTAAVLRLSSAISLELASCNSSSLANLGKRVIRDVDDSAGGIGKSLMAFKREAVVGNDVAHELMTASCSGGDNVVGASMDGG